MHRSVGYGNVNSLGMLWLPLSRFWSRAVGVAVSGEGEANGGGDGMAVGSTGVGSDPGQRGIEPI